MPNVLNINWNGEETAGRRASSAAGSEQENLLQPQMM